jgi:phage FluMu protein gp41
MKLEERYIRFVNNVTTTMSDEQISKIKVVDLKKLYNFVVEHFLI